LLSATEAELRITVLPLAGWLYVPLLYAAAGFNNDQISSHWLDWHSAAAMIRQQALHHGHYSNRNYKANDSTLPSRENNARLKECMCKIHVRMIKHGNLSLPIDIRWEIPSKKCD